jgi:hypothetical protein
MRTPKVGDLLSLICQEREYFGLILSTPVRFSEGGDYSIQWIVFRDLLTEKVSISGIRLPYDREMIRTRMTFL